MTPPLAMTGDSDVQGARRSAFTLLEILAVVTIILILLGVAAVGFSGAGGAKARKAARGEVVAMLTRARSQAIASGNPTAMVMVGLEDGPEKMRGKALCLFEVRKNEANETYEAVKQLRRWQYLPGRTLLLPAAEVSAGLAGGVSALDEDSVLQVEVPPPGGNSEMTVAVHAVVFESTGAVSYPSGSGRIGFYIGEGTYNNQGLVITGKGEDGKAAVDRVVLSRLTGRAQSIAAK